MITVAEFVETFLVPNPYFEFMKNNKDVPSKHSHQIRNTSQKINRSQATQHIWKVGYRELFRTHVSSWGSHKRSYAALSIAEHNEEDNKFSFLGHFFVTGNLCNRSAPLLCCLVFIKATAIQIDKCNPSNQL